MEPTIGRIVYVKNDEDSQIYPAIVCEVHSVNCISVQYFGRNGGGFLSSVVQSENLESNGRCWDWMPFQKANQPK